MPGIASADESPYPDDSVGFDDFTGYEGKESLSFDFSSSDEEEDDAQSSSSSCKVAWESRRQEGQIFDPRQETRNDIDVELFAQPLERKQRGNERFAAKDWKGAYREYHEGVELLEAIMEKIDTRYGTNGNVEVSTAGSGRMSKTNRQATSLLGILYGNASAASLKMGDAPRAIALAQRAGELCPKWPKALYRLAEAYFQSKKYKEALGACMRGENLCIRDSEGRTQEFSSLLDRIAVRAAMDGDVLAVFHGRQLEVRSAGEEAWLGRPAPHVPSLDGPLDEDSALPTDSLEDVQRDTAENSKPNGTARELKNINNKEKDLMELQNSLNHTNNDKQHQHETKPSHASARRDALVGWSFDGALASRHRQRTSFRCLKEAMKAARDGDRILMLRGTHNGMGECVTIDKRVLIEGQGSLGETVIDQRANVPTFRICHGGGGAVIRNLDIDQSGFRESILVTGEGRRHVAPLVDRCIVKCSGDDAVNVAGSAAPIFQRCVFKGKKCGIKAFGRSSTTIIRCEFEKCGEQSIKIAERARLIALRCSLRDSEEEGVVAMGNGRGRLALCSIEGAKGPGIDVSDEAWIAISGGTIRRCVGGVWAWDKAHVQMERVDLDGGPSQVVLSDSESTVFARSCRIKGTVHAGDAIWKGLLSNENQFEEPDEPTDFPIEEGPFVWNPPKYTSL